MGDEALLQEELQRIKAAVKENFRRVKRVQNRRLAQATAQAAQASRASAAARLKDDAVVSSAEDSQARNTTFREAQYLVHYLDYIFPIQYTFYVDAPEEGGRGWLFFLLERSAPLRNAALTLSAFHQHISSPYRTENQEDELLNYHTKALQELRQIIGRREVGGFADSREEWLEFLAALVSVANDLKPSEFDFYPPDPSSPDFDFLRGMNTAQKFLLANLLWIDVLAPVSTGEAPKLPYREWLEAGKIDMSRVMGCQNSIVVAIGDLVAVDSKAGSMNTETLQEHILELEKQIFDGMEAALEVETATKQSTSVTRSVTHLFATSALVQLYTLASEYGLTAPDPHQAVLRVIEVLEQMPANISLRGTPWPLCVAGSMALPPQQQYFDDLLKGLLTQDNSSQMVSTSMRDNGFV
ncbi:hypothetical protein Neosp_010351 [[Neocosmospora] mangrovei]